MEEQLNVSPSFLAPSSPTEGEGRRWVPQDIINKRVPFKTQTTTTPTQNSASAHLTQSFEEKLAPRVKCVRFYRRNNRS